MWGALDDCILSVALDNKLGQAGMILSQTPFVVLGSVDYLASCCWLID